MMSMAKLLEKMMLQLEINNNSLCACRPRRRRFPTQIIPIDCYDAEAVYSTAGDSVPEVLPDGGRQFIFDYNDIIPPAEISAKRELGAPNIEACGL
jgi:hypothetical protein